MQDRHAAHVPVTGVERAEIAHCDPARDLGPLFAAVQFAGVFEDSKTFVDARPVLDPADVVTRYVDVRDSAWFNLPDFVRQHFELPAPIGEGYRSDPSRSMEQHVRALWPVLTREPDDPDPRSSLIPLPHAYVVPGGRFREVYYWDSYFTMLGLIESGRTDLVRGMLDNFAHLLRTAGHIPNGNRTYYLSRSQPPFFAAMIGLYAGATDTTQALRYLDALEAEHAFWMQGRELLTPAQAHRRVVMLRDGSILNRYWDDHPTPRPESYREDYELGMTLPEREREAFYRNVRAAAESGWDFSSRWMRDPADLRTLETTDLIAIDLNSLLYHAERTIAALRRFRGDVGDVDVASRFEVAADERRRSLLAAARLHERLLLRRPEDDRRARNRPADAGRSDDALLRTRLRCAGCCRGRPYRAGIPAARRVRDHADRIGTAVGRAQWLAAAAMDGHAGRASLRPRRSRGQRARTLDRAEPAHL